MTETREPPVEPAEFESFWQATLAAARALAAERPPTFEPVSTPLRAMTVDDVTFPGFGGHPIRGWLLRPTGGPGPRPIVFEYLG
jgi:cephalosporin-C deacetylase